MARVLRLPTNGGVFLDDRGGERSLRVSWHTAEGQDDEDDGADALVVLSLWRGEVCAATFRLEASEVAGLIEALQAGLGGSAPRHDRAC